MRYFSFNAKPQIFHRNNGKQNNLCCKNDEIKPVFEVFFNEFCIKFNSTLLMTMLQVIQYEVMLLNMINYPKCIEKSNFGSVPFLKRQHFLI